MSGEDKLQKNVAEVSDNRGCLTPGLCGAASEFV
jgi:hypothetical protein